MTAPRVGLPSVYAVSSKAPLRFTTISGVVTIINNSATDQIWLGNSGSLVPGVAGWPLQAQASCQYGQENGNTDLWMALDPSASNPVQVVVGGDLSLWSPSPVKVVTISGPVTVSGTVSISGTVSVAGSVSISSGTVNVGTITGTVTITGPVTVTNTPGVIPIGQWTQVLNNVSGTQTLSSAQLANANAIMILSQWTDSTPLAATDVGQFGVELDFGAIVIDQQQFYVMGSWWDDTLPGLRNGGSAKTVIPLRGANGVIITPALINLAAFTYSVFVTNLDLPFSHDTILPEQDTLLLWSNSHTLAAGGSKFPIPITSSPVRIYTHLLSSSGSNNLILSFVDVFTGETFDIFTITRGGSLGAEQYYNGTTSAFQPDTARAYYELPNNLRPFIWSSNAVSGNIVNVWALKARQEPSYGL